MKRRNPRFGYLKIAQTIADTFGIEINKDVVRRILAHHYYPDTSDGGPSWLTVIGHAKDSLWSIDFFKCESILLHSFWVLVVIDVFTRRFVGFAVKPADPDGPAVCRMLNHAIAGKTLPKYLSSDHDPLFRFHRWLANLQILDIEELKAVPFTPVSHPFVERLIGTVRREFLDQILFWNQRDLEHKLADFQSYYNRYRVHSAIEGTTPHAFANAKSSASANLADFTWQAHCNGLFMTPTSACV
ncbi:MAG: integrase core domain-containing protein [Acidimicrobiia bacterium]